jgi:hypothetical protein
MMAFLKPKEGLYFIMQIQEQGRWTECCGFYAWRKQEDALKTLKRQHKSFPHERYRIIKCTLEPILDIPAENDADLHPTGRCGMACQQCEILLHEMNACGDYCSTCNEGCDPNTGI